MPSAYYKVTIEVPLEFCYSNIVQAVRKGLINGLLCLPEEERFKPEIHSPPSNGRMIILLRGMRENRGSSGICETLAQEYDTKLEAKFTVSGENPFLYAKGLSIASDITGC